MQSLDKSGVDLEAGECGDGGRRNSAAVSGGRPFSSEAVEVGNTEVPGLPEKRISSVSECSVEVDLVGASAKEETKLHFLKTERDCRICHLSMDSENQEPSGGMGMGMGMGVFIELGCSCKDDLAAAHKQCAEAWFKIKGNRICEICGSIASNVVCVNEAESIEMWSEANAAAVAGSRAAPQVESQRFWQGHRFLNFMLACMVFAFVISWLFHFNVSS
ncbi:PREDICTED: uncharacterized protein LOC109153434 [Ipomoea nil]|uniref:uncharacterized protein LOC109153434 n=1 Tax=Ipomoea nil TaxID=35883 RepID=UPI000900EFAF|nr:PREDICTED: uncharacterized protein LOC109153434 [Ipomoea nil]